MFFTRRKSRLERTRDRIQDLAESGKAEAKKRTSSGELAANKVPLGKFVLDVLEGEPSRHPSPMRRES